jgi:poly(ADP-ribose) glycohydrolase ARH3
MRAAPVGLFYHRDPAALHRAAELAASITHAHPIGIEGGVLLARATALALDERLGPADFLDAAIAGCGRAEFVDRLRAARSWLDRPPEPREVARTLGTGVEAHLSAATALYAFCRFPADFRALMEFVVSLGGDVDTIGAMAGGLLGARAGASALPADLLGRLEARERIEHAARALYRASCVAPSTGPSPEGRPEGGEHARP